MTRLSREQSLTQNNLFALKQLNSNQSHLIDLPENIQAFFPI